MIPVFIRKDQVGDTLQQVENSRSRVSKEPVHQMNSIFYEVACTDTLSYLRSEP